MAEGAVVDFGSLAEATLELPQLDSTPASSAGEGTQIGGDGTAQSQGGDGTKGAETILPEGTKPPDTGEVTQGEQKTGDGTQQQVTPLEPTPQNVRNYLKTLKAEGANAKIVKEIHNAYERINAYGDVYKTVQEARDARAVLESVGGAEGIETLRNFKDNVEASDQLLYEGNPEVVTNIVSDLKEQGRLDALGKLASPFLEALFQFDKEGFQKAMLPYFVQDFLGSEFPKVFDTEILPLLKALDEVKKSEDGKSDVFTYSRAQIAKALNEALAKVNTWHNGRQKQVEESKKTVLTPEMEKFNRDKEAFNKEKTDFQTEKQSTFQQGVAQEAIAADKKALIKPLAEYLKAPFFKDFPRETLQDLANSIMSDLRKTLKADAAYQMQMKALWKKADKDKILEYHNAKVDSIAEDIVRGTVQRRYPSFAKGATAAAGRVAAAAAKKEGAGAGTQQQPTGKGATYKDPIYVAQRPDRKNIDWTAPNADEHLIMGRALLKDTKKWVTWRKPMAK